LAQGFGPLLPDTVTVHSATSRPSKKNWQASAMRVLVEPIQAEAHSRSAARLLRGAQDLCRRYGTLLVADEVQTGCFAPAVSGVTSFWHHARPCRSCEGFERWLGPVSACSCRTPYMVPYSAPSNARSCTRPPSARTTFPCAPDWQPSMYSRARSLGTGYRMAWNYSSN